MRRPRWAGGLALAFAFAAGCAHPREASTHTTAWYDRVRGWTGLQPAEGSLVLQTCLIDRPAPDPILDHDIWDAAHTSNPLPAELSALLELNGIRVRVTGSIPPPKLLALLRSGDAVDAKLRTAKPDEPRVIPVNGPVDELRYAVFSELRADPTPTELNGVECGLAIAARPADNGRVTLHCEPRVQHGERQSWLRPTADGTGFARRDQKPTETYPTLGFEVTLAPGEYLLIGATPATGGTLGQAFFTPSAGDRVNQRVLVVQAGKAGVNSAMSTGPTTAAAAAQAAGRPTARGSAR